MEMFDLDRNTLVHPYYDYDDKRSCHPSLSDEEFVTQSTATFKKAVEYICSIYDVRSSALAIADDNRPTKQSYHIVVPSRYCKGDVLRDLVHHERKQMLALHLDIQVYSKTNQKWKTLYSPKLDDQHSAGMNIVQNDDISAHIVQCGDDFTEMTEFVGIPVPIALPVHSVVIRNHKQQDIVTRATDVLKQLGDTTSVFHEFKNYDDNSLLFRRTCESQCCWNNTHSNNAFILKLVKPNTWYYWCYGNGCGNGRMFKIDATNNYNECDDTAVEDILEVFKNSTEFKYDFFQQLDNRVVDNIAFVIDSLQRLLAKFTYLCMNSTGVYVQVVGSRYYFRKPELMKLDMNRFEFTIFDARGGMQVIQPYDLLRTNRHMIAIERVVTEPEYPRFQHIHFEQQTVFNLWNGFPMMNTIENDSEFGCIGNVSLEEAVSVMDSENRDSLHPGLLMILNHIRYILCNNVHEQYMEMIYSIASLIQKPTKRLPVIVLRSPQGVGKNIIFEELIAKRIITPDYSIISDKIDTFVGKFNTAIEGKMFGILDECDMFIGNHAINSLLKSLATQSTVLIEPKGLNPYRVNSYMNLVVLTNSKAPLKLEETNRRYNLYDVNDDIVLKFMKLPDIVRGECCNKNEYFSKLSAFIQDTEVVEQFVRFMVSIDSKSHQSRIFQSISGHALRELSKTPFELYCDALNGNSSVGTFGPLDCYLYLYRINDEKIYLIDHLYDVYKDFCTFSELKCAESRQTFIAPFIEHFKCRKMRLRRKVLHCADTTEQLHFFVF